MSLPLALFAIDHWTQINLAHVVWIRREPGTGYTLYMSAPGPDGKHEVRIVEPKAAAALARLIDPRHE